MQTGGSGYNTEPIGPCSRRITKERQRRHDPKKSRHAADHDKILLKSAALLFAARPTGIVKVEVAGEKSTGTSGALYEVGGPSEVVSEHCSTRTAKTDFCRVYATAEKKSKGIGIPMYYM